MARLIDKYKILSKYKYTPLPSPSKEEMDSDIFKAIYDIVKDWDISTNRPHYSVGNGTHVKLILDALYPIIRNNKIDDIIE